MSQLHVQIKHRYPSGFTLDVDFKTEALKSALFGPSGSGKTTILMMIAGMLHPDQGRITLGDQTLLDCGAGIRVAPEDRRIGLVFQDHLLFPHMNVEKNLRYGLKRRKNGHQRITFEKVVECLELAPHLRQAPQTLSGGQQQRVALGRALLRGPELLLMDEPLTALDEALKLRVLESLERVVDEWRIPMLFVSHIHLEVKRLAEKVIVLQDGRLVGEGDVNEVLKRHETRRPTMPGAEILDSSGSKANEFLDGLTEIANRWPDVPQSVREAVLEQVRNGDQSGKTPIAPKGGEK